MFSEDTLQQSPLVDVDLNQVKASETELKIRELAFQGHVNLRGSTGNPYFVSSVEAILGVSPLMENNTFSETENFTVLWYGPNEWLIVTPGGKEDQLVEQLRKDLSDQFAAVTDVTGGNTILEISGARARDLLACGSMIDFHPSQFGVGQCAQTLFAKAGATIYQVAEPDTFRLIIRRSFSDYLGTWLVDTANSLK